MAYIYYEDVKPALIHRRIVPRLRKYYRGDGTFDLFDVNNLQMNCLYSLAQQGYAGLECYRKTNKNHVAYGSYILNNVVSAQYILNTSSSDFNTVGLYFKNTVRYGAYSFSGFILNLNNPVGLYPHSITLTSTCDHPGGDLREIIAIGDNQTKTISYTTGSNGSSTWNSLEGSIENMLDPTDYTDFYATCYADDGSKFTSAQTWLTAKFIHKFGNGHSLHRYYT